MSTRLKVRALVPATVFLLVIALSGCQLTEEASRPSTVATPAGRDEPTGSSRGDDADEADDANDEADNANDEADNADEGADNADEGADNADEGADNADEGADNADEGADNADEGADDTADRDCTGAELDQIGDTVAGQLDAFAAQEFETALHFATPGFRDSYTPEQFEAMITSTFPIPADATAHQLLDCVRLADGAAVTVRISGAGGQQDYTYGVRLLEEGWRIDGAVPVGPVEPPAEVVMVDRAEPGGTVLL